MELELEKGAVGQVQGDVEVELPDYMTPLPSEQLKEVVQCDWRGRMIIAAGREPDSGDIVMMTGDGRLLQLKNGDHGIPEGNVAPIDWGHAVAIETIESGYFEVASDWAIKNAESLGIDLT